MEVFIYLQCKPTHYYKGSEAADGIFCLLVLTALGD